MSSARGGGAGAPARTTSSTEQVDLSRTSNGRMSRQAKSRKHRTCIGCRRVAPAGELVRVARRPDGALAVGRHEPGRGAWLCAGTTGECFEAAVRRRAFGRALRADVSGDQLALVRGKLLA